MYLGEELSCWDLGYRFTVRSPYFICREKTILVTKEIYSFHLNLSKIRLVNFLTGTTKTQL